MINILYLPLKAKWFNMIKSRIKPEEYREMTPYWAKRLYGCPANIDWCKTKEPVCGRCSCLRRLKPKQYSLVWFTLGYPKKNNLSRNMVIKTTGTTYGKGNPEWGAPTDRDVFIIKLRF